MDEFIQHWGPSLVPLLIQLLYLVNKLGEIVTRLQHVEKRIERLEDFRDAEDISRRL